MLWLSLSFAVLLLGVAGGCYWVVDRHLEWRTYHQLEWQILDKWSPRPPRPSFARPPGPRDPGMGPPRRFHRPPRWGHERLKLVMPGHGIQVWDQIATRFIVVRYYDLKLQRLIQKGGPPDQPAERVDLLQRMLREGRESTRYTSSNTFERWLMWAQLVRNAEGKPVGVVETGMGTREADELLAALAGSIALVGLFGVGLGGIVSAWLASQLAQPLERVVATMGTVSEGDFSARVPEVGPLEVRALARTFNSMVDQVGQAFAAQKRFVADASHELKTPLTSIGTMVELLRDQAQQLKPERLERAWRVVDKEIGRMTQLIKDLLTLSALGETPELEERVAVDQVLREVVLDYQLTRQNLHLGELPEVSLWCDANGLQRITRNLLDNALAHTTAPAEVWLDLRVEREQMCLEVRDQGSGIPAEEISKVTDRFYRSDPSRSRLKGGTGLGLSIVEAWVEQLGGRLQLESELGKGTTVQLWIPVKDKPSES